MAGKQQRDSVDVWRERLRRQSQGKCSVAQFCHEEGISEASFYRWRKLLGAGPRRRYAKRQAVRGSAPEFVPVELPTCLLSSGVEIDLPGGAVVRLPQSASAEIVRVAVQAACASELQREAQQC